MVGLGKDGGKKWIELGLCQKIVGWFEELDLMFLRATSENHKPEVLQGTQNLLES